MLPLELQIWMIHTTVATVMTLNSIKARISFPLGFPIFQMGKLCLGLVNHDYVLSQSAVDHLWLTQNLSPKKTQRFELSKFVLVVEETSPKSLEVMSASLMSGTASW